MPIVKQIKKVHQKKFNQCVPCVIDASKSASAGARSYALNGQVQASVEVRTTSGDNLQNKVTLFHIYAHSLDFENSNANFLGAQATLGASNSLILQGVD